VTPTTEYDSSLKWSQLVATNQYVASFRLSYEFVQCYVVVSITDCVSQLQPHLRWCMIGVRKIVLIDVIIDVRMVFSSTDIRAGGRLMLLLEQPSH
jgi:hypothetical protein